MLVKDYMTLNPRSVNPDDDGQIVAEMLKSLNYSQFPVVEKNILVGLVTLTHLTNALAENENTKVKDVMITEPMTIMEDASIENASEILRIKDLSALPVVSENNELVGFITISDILNALRATFSFRDKPIKLEVDMSDELGLFDVLHLIQNNSEKVISFSSAPVDRSLSHFWVVDCDLGRVDKVLREHHCKMSVIESDE